MTKEEAFQRATLENLSDAHGTRMDIVYAAMELYAQQFKAQEPKSSLNVSELNDIVDASVLYVENMKSFCIEDVCECFEAGADWMKRRLTALRQIEAEPKQKTT